MYTTSTFNLFLFNALINKIIEKTITFSELEVLFDMFREMPEPKGSKTTFSAKFKANKSSFTTVTDNGTNVDDDDEIKESKIVFNKKPEELVGGYRVTKYKDEIDIEHLFAHTEESQVGKRMLIERKCNCFIFFEPQEKEYIFSFFHLFTFRYSTTRMVKTFQVFE